MAGDSKFGGTENYIASQELKDIVHVAQVLERPLLIRGEPGTGKTMLAKAVAESLQLSLHTWHVKSTSKAQEGLYTYDAVQRLNDSRFGGGDVNKIENYIKLGPLGESFASDDHSVVLIDEIDKADVEFPNDLLHELDAMSFYIPETRQTIKAKRRPMVIISSNAEKELPDAFLRRCVFHYISFPDQKQMADIVKVHHPNIEKKLLDQCLVKFYWLREQDAIGKKPSTSELIDWVSALARAKVPIKRLEKEFPFIGVLLKKEKDLSSFANGFRESKGRYF